MKRARFAFMFGIWIAILPYLGFPLVWKNLLFSLSGLTLSYLGYVLYKEYRKLHDQKEKFDSFSENTRSEGK